MLSKALQAVAGNAGEAVYVEDVFSTYLYTGNGSTQTITNGIDLAGDGGLVWIKGRSGATDNALYDTFRGTTKDLISNSTAAQTTQSTGLTAFNTTGFSIGALAKLNTNAATYASWTFRKAEKFFDVVTWTGNGSNRTISHNLGSVPGCIIVKKTSSADNWFVQHRSLGATKYIALNDADVAYANSQLWNNTAPTSTVFTLGTNSGVNQNGSTYVAYLFAHDAGGFGADGTENVISCGSYTGTGAAGNAVTLGYEPQWVMIKKTTSATQSDWVIFDNMRGWPVAGSADNYLWANSSNAEGLTSTGWVSPTATGFQFDDGQGRTNGSGETYIYIAIRRGPMKTPESGTEVFYPQAYADQSLGTSNNPQRLGENNTFVTDAFFHKIRTVASTSYFTWLDRLRGNKKSLVTSLTAAEPAGDGSSFDSFNKYQYGVTVDPNGTFYYWSSAAGDRSHISYHFRRAPGFMDVVCYSGTGVARTVNHNLGVAPELMIFKNRTTAGTSWLVYSAALGATKFLSLNATSASATSNTPFNDTEPTASVFTVRSASNNTSGTDIVAYLFSTCPGVSKVGSYTGSGTTKQINCGFSGGARFVMIKRTDSTGDWYVWDTARGIVSGNDPYFVPNTSTIEVTSTDYIDPYSAGFEISSTAPAAINANGGSFIYLAIA